MNYSSATAYLNSFTNHESSTGHNYSPENYNLNRMMRILNLLDCPHSKYPSIHIAGTKGKGSVAAMTESVIRMSGKNTGLYTSPHLHSVRERIQINGKPINKKSFTDTLEKLKPSIETEKNITYYEILTLIAFQWFATNNIDVAILEVGLGGRLDATNVVNPILSVITTISYDHMNILGQTIDKIAAEKSGIIKHTVPVITGSQPPDALSTIKSYASELKAPLMDSSSIWCWKSIKQTFESQTFSVWKKKQDHSLMNYSIPLLGVHQITNSTIVLSIIDCLNKSGWNITIENVHKGLSKVKWYARCEIVESSPPIIIDCAHNPASIISLNQMLDNMFPNKERIYIFGAMADKDVSTMFNHLMPTAYHTILTSAGLNRSMTVQDLNLLAKKHSAIITIKQELDKALKFALQLSNQNRIVIATGSVPVAAGVRSLITNEQ
ncbi:MAG TPA: hypothetical protein DCL76_07205 [Chloroflexi bacterium]|nr:hypothetical protein [Chloroflexota bacterium]|tara:strand:- start:343 stop:1656 length:1314 start_codon:yes stop_codon:yes gene_type:complete